MSAKKDKAPGRDKILDVYRQYFMEFGELPDQLKTFNDYGGWTYESFRRTFTNLAAVEIEVILDYFKKAANAVGNDEQFEAFDLRDKHLAYLYTCVEHFNKDDIFLGDMLHLKKTDGMFWKRFIQAMWSLEFPWADSAGWSVGPLPKIGMNSYKAALVQHSMGTLLFWTKDSSEEGEDVDAFIEKSTDVLFRLTDPGTLNSVFDFGKFMFSRSGFSKATSI